MYLIVNYSNKTQLKSLKFVGTGVLGLKIITA